MSSYPELMHTALDTTNARGLTEFYRELLGRRYRPGDERPADGEPDDADWLVLERHLRRAEELGAKLLLDRTDDVDEPLYVLADPAGHPFCLLVA